MMIRAYSQRMLPPYSGVVQIAETARARAQSVDGVTWEIQYLPGNEQATREQGYATDRNYFRVAHVHDGELKTYIIPKCLNQADVVTSIDELSAFLSTAQIPFPAADIFEYWLLDSVDQAPLALILSCCAESQMASLPARAEWTALPHSKVRIENTADERERSEPPVNHRIQRLIAERSGSRPKAAWFRRDREETVQFPSCLVREDWQQEADHDLCQRYLHRIAPRLLMLQGLSHDERERLEIAAKQYAAEVDEYYPLYPEINDQQRMSAIRVEARLRRNMPQTPNRTDQEKTSDVKRMSKDMRIFET